MAEPAAVHFDGDQIPFSRAGRGAVPVAQQRLVAAPEGVALLGVGVDQPGRERVVDLGDAGGDGRGVVGEEPPFGRGEDRAGGDAVADRADRVERGQRERRCRQAVKLAD
jgi:hypothetical protein